MLIDSLLKLATIAGAFIVILQLWLRYRLHKQEVALKREAHQLDREKWGKQMATSHILADTFSGYVPRLASDIKSELIKDVSWLEIAARKTHFMPFENAIFGERSEHYQEEKDFIAQQFTPLLIEYIEFKLGSKTKLVLFIDSGTTMFPFFSYLHKMVEGMEPHRQKNFLGRVEIITTNIPGLLELLRASNNSVNIKCTLLAGQPVREYGSIAGSDTDECLSNIYHDRRTTTGDDCFFIAMITGNWVRLRKTDPICPIPLATREEHLGIKKMASHLSNETFVICPLGKIFATADLEKINELFRGLIGPYKEINTSESDYYIDPECLRLITTARTKGDQLLRSHSERIYNRYEERGIIQDRKNLSHLSKLEISSLPYLEPIIFPFNLNQTVPTTQLHIEFPLEFTHNQHFASAFSVRLEEHGLGALANPNV